MWRIAWVSPYIPSAIPIRAWLSPPESRWACTANTGRIKKSPSMRRENSDASERLARNSNGDMQGASGLRGEGVQLAGGAGPFSIDPFEQGRCHQRGHDGHQHHDGEQRRFDDPLLQADIENDELHHAARVHERAHGHRDRKSVV